MTNLLQRRYLLTNCRGGIVSHTNRFCVAVGYPAPPPRAAGEDRRVAGGEGSAEGRARASVEMVSFPAAPSFIT